MIFKTSAATGDAQRKDKLSALAPVIKAVSPSPVRAGAATLTIDGAHFTDTTFLLIDGRQLDAKLVPPTQLLPTDEERASAARRRNLPVAAVDQHRPHSRARRSVGQ